jgi:glycogen debranching enzyme
MVMSGGDVRRALALLYSASYRADRGIPGQLPEVADGNTPHREQGCAAQAWSVTEFYRVAKLLTGAE